MPQQPIAISKMFPLTAKITFLDSAATTLKPLVVSEAIKNFYLNYPLNPHSKNSPLAMKVNDFIAQTRSAIATLVDGSSEEVIFTTGATDGLNLMATMMRPLIKKDDEILLSYYNHNANLIPWIELAKQTGAKCKIVKTVIPHINAKTALVAVSQKSHAFKNDETIQAIFAKAKQNDAIVINDAAQAIVFEKVSLTWSDAIVFSGNKIYGPTGIGALIVKEQLLKQLRPAKFGGGATVDLTPDQHYELVSSVAKFEPGTPNGAGIVGLNAALTFLKTAQTWNQHVANLTTYLIAQLKQVTKINVLSTTKMGIVIFDHKVIPAEDVASFLAFKHNIYVRSGAFCAHLSARNKAGSIRVSLGIYNTKGDVDRLVNVLQTSEDHDYI